MNIIPTASRLFVKPDIQEMTPGGIVIPDTSRKAPTTGIVLAAGKCKDDRLVEDARIIYRQHSEEEVEVLGEKCYLIHETDILAVLDGE